MEIISMEESKIWKFSIFVKIKNYTNIHSL